MKAYELACTQPWAITPEALAGILAIAGRVEVTPEMIVALHGYTYDAVEAQRGRRVDNTDRVDARDGVAIIRVEGSIVRHGDMFSDVSGSISVNGLARDFTTALGDPAIRAILFAIDSPGGEVNGINEFSDMVYAARGQKPISAYISHLGCSAAYWIASACDQIVADAAAQVGSIGVVGTMPNPEKDAKRTVEFISSQSPHKRPNIATEGGRAQVQARVDALADVFVGAVARNRKVSQATVLKDFGGGGIFVGKDAVKAGLVDRIGSFEATLAALAVRAKTEAEADAAAATTGGTIVAQEEQGQGRGKGFWARWIGSDEPTTAEDVAPSFDSASRRIAPATQEDPRVKELEARLKASEEREFKTAADNFVESAIRSNKAIPAEAAKLRALYIQAARDDAAHGESIRVDHVTASMEARQTHAITGERLKGQFALLPNTLTTAHAEDAAALDEDEADARTWAKKQNERAAR